MKRHTLNIILVVCLSLCACRQEAHMVEDELREESLEELAVEKTEEEIEKTEEVIAAVKEKYLRRILEIEEENLQFFCQGIEFGGYAMLETKGSLFKLDQVDFERTKVEPKTALKYQYTDEKPVEKGMSYGCFPIGKQKRVQPSPKQ